MTTPRQALEVLGRLHREYSPVLDALLTATESNVDKIVAEEQRLAQQIWENAPIAFGAARGATLEILKPIKPDEVREIAGAPTFNEAHRLALIGCCVRSRRLGSMLQEARQRPTPGETAKQARIMWQQMEADQGPPAVALRRYKEIAGKLDCEIATVKKAITRKPKRLHAKQKRDMSPRVAQRRDK